MNKIHIFLLLIAFSLQLKGQYYSIGEDPARIKWRQINTSDFQLIYPSSFETKAQRMASVLLQVYRFAGNTLDHQPRKISVILHTGTVMSNGVVIWAPSRVELFTTPPQDIYAHDWLEQLAIHEIRHVVQMDKIESELPAIFKIILGEQAAAAAVGAYLPLWFLEGDAVVTETSLSEAGRGRLPSFEMKLKAQVLEKKKFSYDKAYLGSYKDFVPDRYELGYRIVAGTRDRFGAHVWADVLHHVARKPLSLNAFSKGLKKQTGRNQSGLYNELFNEFKQKWEKEDKKDPANTSKRITREDKAYTNYKFPNFVNDTTVFAVKYSMDDLTRFVLIYPDGNEKKIFTPGYLSEESVTYRDNKVIWIESKPDLRWANREMSLLRILDLKTKKLFGRVYAEKIYAPSLSSDNKYIACAKIDDENNCSLFILDPGTGDPIMDVPSPEGYLIITPSWSEDENDLYAVILGPDGKSIMKFNPFNGIVNYLLPFTRNNLSHPVQKGNNVYYNSSQDGTDNVYAINIRTNNVFKITSSRFGTNHPNLSQDGKKLIFSDYTADGFIISQMLIEEKKFEPADPAFVFKYPLAEKIATQEKAVLNMPAQDSANFVSKKYSRLSHLFNFHSWSPFNIDTDNEEIRPGISVLSQNMLSTAVTQLGYEFSTAGKGKWFMKFDYTGFYPEFGFKADYGKVKSQYYRLTHFQNQQGQVIKTDTALVDFYYRELNFDGHIKIPLNLSHGKTLRLIQPEFQIGYTKISLDNSVPAEVFHGTFVPLTYRIYANNYTITSLRDLQPRFGQVIDLVYRHTPFGSINDRTDYGDIRAGEGTIYLPGFSRHHGIKLYGGFQHKNPTLNSLSDLIEYPRGYFSVSNNELLTLKTDYCLPVVYPDLSLGKISYIKRIWLKVFYDYANATIPVAHSSESISRKFNSIGGELYMDSHFFRFIIPTTIGVRQSYLVEDKKTRLEFLVTFNLNQFSYFK